MSATQSSAAGGVRGCSRSLAPSGSGSRPSPCSRSAPPANGRPCPPNRSPETPPPALASPGSPKRHLRRVREGTALVQDRRPRGGGAEPGQQGLSVRVQHLKELLA